MIKDNYNCCSSENGSKPNCTLRKGGCPVCGKQGNSVKNITVKHLVLDELKDQVGDSDYYICMDEGCNTVYYNMEEKGIFNKNQIKVPIWFKNDADPKYVCYCSKVTEEQLLNAIVKEGAKDMKDIMRLTGAMKNGKCPTHNPTGKCCHKAIEDTLEKGLILSVVQTNLC